MVSTAVSSERAAPGRRHLVEPGGGGARRWLVVGVCGAALIALALALLMSVVAPPFSAGDENEHVSYALEVGHGRLPTLSTQVRPEIPGMRYDDTYTANHPPLFYALEAVPLLVGTRTGHPVLGLHLARALNALIGAAGVVALAVLARVVVPRRPDVAIAAAALLAPVPLLVAVSGQVYNDALAVATSTGALVAAATVLLRGPSRRRLAVLAGAALLATATRATGGEPAALAVLAAAVAVLVHATSRGWRRVASSAAAAAAVAVPVLLGIGWFFERNRRLYGDPTGSRQALRRFPDQRVPVLHSVLSGHFWLHQYTGMFGRAQFFSGALRSTVYAVGVVLAVGALLAVGAGLAALLNRARRSRSRRSPSTGTVATLSVLALHVLATGVIVLVYLSQGGIPYPRYLLAAVPVLALLVSYGYAVASRYGLLVAAAPCLLALVGLALVVGSHGNAFRQPPGLTSAHRLSVALHASGVPHSGLVLSAVALVLVAAVALVLAALVALRPRLDTAASRAATASVAISGV